MRRLLILSLLLALGGTQQAQARLFWQTYGSVAEHPGGCGCGWNENQDYFVPRQCHSGRYDLFSPCKTSCTDSPACKHQHPMHPGYCTVYGPCRYCWRNHVYRCYCGCCGLHPYKCNGVRAHWCGPLRYGCGAGCGHCGHHGFQHGCYCGVGNCYSPQHANIWPQQPAPNLEPFGVEYLGRVPVQGDELLASIGLDLEETDPTEIAQPVPEVTLPVLGQPVGN